MGVHFFVMVFMVRSPLRQMAAVGGAFVAGAVAFFLVLQLVRGDGGVGEVVPVGGGEAGAVAVGGLEGKRWVLSDHRGKVVLLNYFATWCGPCREETPELVKIAKDYAGRVEMVAVGLDQGDDRAKLLGDFGREYGMTYPILLPGGSAG